MWRHDEPAQSSVRGHWKSLSMEVDFFPYTQPEAWWSLTGRKFVIF